MNKALVLLAGLGVGAVLMYFMDPDRGRSRRALARDKAVGLANDISDSAQKTATDLSNRASGMMHEAKKMVGMDRDAVDAEMPMRLANP